MNFNLSKLTQNEDGSSRKLLTKADLGIMLAITLIYAVVAFSALGAFDNPQTLWNASSVDESVTITFDQPHNISKVFYYGGICKKQNFTVQYYDSNMKQISSQSVEYKLNTMFRWQIANAVEAVNVSSVTIRPEEAGLVLMEVAFVDADASSDGNVFIQPSGSYLLTNESKKEENTALIDEQETVPERPSYMKGTYFDEIYHGRTAYEYIHGMKPYDTSHPPLGKIIISIGIRIFGMVPFGWRCMGTLLGVLMLPVIYLTGKQLFNNTAIAAFVTAALALDCMHFTQTRISTIDGIAAFFILLMFFFMFRYVIMVRDDVEFRKTLIPLGLAGITMGLGVATKWNAVYAGIGLAILFFGIHIVKLMSLKKNPGSSGRKAATPFEKYLKNMPMLLLFCVAFFVVIPSIIYCVSYVPHLAPTGYSLDAVWRAQTHMYNFHSNLNSTHNYSSEWWSWPLIKTPLWFHVNIHHNPGMAENIYDFGNPIVWWSGICAVLTIPLAMIVNRKARESTAAWCILVAFASQYVPWIFVSRLSFIYYYFPSAIMSILAIGWWFWFLNEMTEKIENEKTRKIVRLVLLAAGIIFILIALYLFRLFFPLLTGSEITVEQTTYLKGLLNMK